MYKEEDFLQLSGIQHFAFCRRQWALAYIELQWQENVRTVEGKIFHENAHDVSMKEKRGDLLIVRAMSVHSPATAFLYTPEPTAVDKTQNVVFLIAAKIPLLYTKSNSSGSLHPSTCHEIS